MPGKRKGEGTRYAQILEQIFVSKYEDGAEVVGFVRQDITRAAAQLQVKLPKNLGDVIYAFRYRVELPSSIQERAPKGKSWIIRYAGRAKYEFAAVQTGADTVTPGTLLAETKVPDATPGIIRSYALNDEQALLAIIRYNRLIDIFSGVAAYSLQTHLKTTLSGLGQIVIDEIYVGIDKRGAQYVFPIEAAGRRSAINITQMEQCFAVAEEKFPAAICRPIAAFFMRTDRVALFEFERQKDGIAVSAERHYRLVPHEEISDDDLRTYGQRSG